MFRAVFPSIIRSLRMYIQHQVYVKQILLTACKQLDVVSVRYLTTSDNCTSDNLPRVQNQRLLVQF